MEASESRTGTRRPLAAFDTLTELLGGNSPGGCGELVELLPEAVYCCDAAGCVTAYNSAASDLWGRVPGPCEAFFCGSAKLLFADGTPLDHEKCPMSVALSTGRDVGPVEAMLERPDGTRRNIIAHPRLVRDSNGLVVGAVNVLIDITERKKLENKLAEESRRKDEFLALLAHELRNPLAPIRSAVDVLDSGLDAAQPIRIIRRQVQQLTRLVSDLLDAARISRGQLVVQRDTVRLADVIANATDVVAPLISQHNIRFTVEHPAGDPYVECDPVRFAQMIGNLLHNACKFTPSGGQITLSVEVCGSELQVHVKDTGIGIEAGALAGIFDLFSQSAHGRDHRDGGLGIGLSVVRELAGAHGGTVSVHSDGPDKGSTFTLALPIVVPPVPIDALEHVSLRPATTGIKVLVVDDNVDAADAMQMLLSQFGHHASAAYSGSAALASLEERVPRAVIVDLSMPVMDGFELARRIRNRPSWQSVVLIALSGYGQPDDIQRSREVGFEHHLTKPADPVTLLSLLDSLKPSRPRGAFLHAVR